MVFYGIFNSIPESHHGDRSHYSCLSWAGLLKCLTQGHFNKKTPKDPITINVLTITTQCQILTHQLIYIAVENIVKKGEIACNKQFLLFSQCFPPYIAHIFNSKCTLKLLSANGFNLDQSKILSSGNGLMVL